MSFVKDEDENDEPDDLIRHRVVYTDRWLRAVIITFNLLIRQEGDIRSRIFLDDTTDNLVD